MNDFLSGRFFRLSAGRIECNETGLRIGDVKLLKRDGRGAWTVRDAGDLGSDLSRVYGFSVDVRTKMAGFAAVANALQGRDLAKAQIAALLLRFPDPPPLAGAAPGKSAEQRLFCDLAACGLLKADGDWNEKHPRAGSPPNPGWFASKPKETQSAATPNEGPPSGDGALPNELAFVPPALATGADSLLAENLSAAALDGLVTLATRVSVPTIIFGAIFIPSANRIVDEALVPGRPDLSYRWARDEAEVTFKVLIDNQWRPLTYGRLEEDAIFRDPNGEIVARIVEGPRRRLTLVTSTDVLDSALAGLRRESGTPAAAPTEDADEPRLCPRPTNEPMTTKSKNSIAYQEYVTKLRYGLAIWVGGVFFDGCDPRTGILLEAKADIDFMFDKNDDLYKFVDAKKSPAIQMGRQADAADTGGRIVVWHAQTEKGFRGLSKIAKRIGRMNLFVVHNPN